MILQLTQKFDLPGPNEHDLSPFRIHLDRQRLEGPDRYVWRSKENGYESARDLISVKRRIFPDKISRKLCEIAIPFLVKRYPGVFERRDEYLGIPIFEDEMVQKITDLLSMVVANFLPFLSVVILFLVDSMKMRLVVLGVLNVGFTVALRTLTLAKRTEIFATTAAFLAVSVVFIGNNYPAA